MRRDLETNFYGPLLVTGAFAPIIERKGGGHILNVHSALSWLADGTPYSASKAALWSQTNSLRLELQPRGIAVTGLHLAYVDTDMTSGIDAPKAEPRDVAVTALDGIEAGAHEVLADDTTRWVKSRWGREPPEPRAVQRSRPGDDPAYDPEADCRLLMHGSARHLLGLSPVPVDGPLLEDITDGSAKPTSGPCSRHRSRALAETAVWMRGPRHGRLGRDVPPLPGRHGSSAQGVPGPGVRPETSLHQDNRLRLDAGRRIGLQTQDDSDSLARVVPALWGHTPARMLPTAPSTDAAIRHEQSSV